MSTSEEPRPDRLPLTDKQVSNIKDILQKNPDWDFYRYLLVRHYFVTQNWNELQKEFIQCIRNTPWNSLILFPNRMAFSNNPSYGIELIQIMENSLQEYPESVGIYYNLGHLYGEMAVPPIHETKDYLDWTRVDTATENIKKVDYSSFKKAEEHLQKALSLFTKRSDKYNCLYALGTLYFCALDYPKAMDCYEQAFQNVSTVDKSMMLFDIGLTYLFMNKIKEAKEHFQKAIDFDKEYAFGIYKNTMLAYEWLGYIVLKENDIELAKYCLRKSAEVKEDRYIMYYGFPLILARKLLKKGVVKEVKEYCIEVMSITSAHKDKVLELLKECDSRLG